MKKGHIVIPSLYEDIIHVRSLSSCCVSDDDNCHELVKNTFKHLLPDNIEPMGHINGSGAGVKHTDHYMFVYNYYVTVDNIEIYICVYIYEDRNEIYLEYKNFEDIQNGETKNATWDETMRRFEFLDKEN